MRSMREYGYNSGLKNHCRRVSQAKLLGQVVT